MARRFTRPLCTIPSVHQIGHSDAHRNPKGRHRDHAEELSKIEAGPFQGFRSTLGLDLYLWLTYRTFSLTRPLRLSWRQVYRQFGVDPAKASDKRTVDAFRTKCLRQLKKIKLV